MSTRASVVRYSPTSTPPVTTLSTPGGKSASCAAAPNSSASNGVKSEGFSTTVHPAARAGPTLSRLTKKGALNGVIAVTTPRGERCDDTCPQNVGAVAVPECRDGQRSQRLERGTSVDEEIEKLHRRVELTGPRHRHRDAGLRDHQPHDVVGPAGKHVTQSAQRGRPLCGVIVGHGPSSNARRAAETAASASARRAPRCGGDGFLGRRIQHRRRRFGWSPPTVDEQALVLRSRWAQRSACSFDPGHHARRAVDLDHMARLQHLASGESPYHTGDPKFAGYDGSM